MSAPLAGHLSPWRRANLPESVNSGEPSAIGTVSQNDSRHASLRGRIGELLTSEYHATDNPNTHPYANNHS